MVGISSEEATHLHLPRKCPIIITTDLYNTPGDGDESVNKLKDTPEVAQLMQAWLNYLRGDIDKVTEHANHILENHTGFNATISGGMLLAMSAMWKGDATLWRRAKRHIYETPAKSGDEYEAVKFWLAATDSELMVGNEFPEWFTIGRFDYLHRDSLPLARFYYAKYLLIAANDLAMGKITLPDISGLGLMRTIPYIVEPMISHAVLGKMVVLEIYMRLVCAISYHNIGDDKNAIHHIDRAIDLALADRLMAILAEHRRHLGSLLDERLALRDPDALKELRKLHKTMMDGWVKIHNELYQRMVSNAFSPRELECARLAAFGLSNKEIAERLYITPGSVKQVISMAMNKTGAVNRLDLGMYI